MSKQTYVVHDCSIRFQGKTIPVGATVDLDDEERKDIDPKGTILKHQFELEAEQEAEKLKTKILADGQAAMDAARAKAAEIKAKKKGDEKKPDPAKKGDEKKPDPAK